MPQAQEQRVVYVGLGSNLGDRAGNLDAAVRALAETDGVVVDAQSARYESRPLTAVSQGAYLNGVVRLRTCLAATSLLERMQGIEASLGRRPGPRWGDRVIDLDLLLYGDCVIEQPGLVVPHPEMHLRSFVLRGLCELDAERVHPRLGVAMRTLAERLNGGDFHRDRSRPQLVSIAGCIGVGKTTLAAALAESLQAELIREAYATNPYLPQVFAGRAELALDSQLYFLRSRAEQLDRRRLVPGVVYVSDYVFEKDRLFARRTLNAEQRAAYKRQAGALVGRVTPAVVVYLEATAELCLERIRQRNRPYERGLRVETLRGLIAEYEALFADWRACPVIRLDAVQVDVRADTSGCGTGLASWGDRSGCGASSAAPRAPSGCRGDLATWEEPLGMGPVWDRQRIVEQVRAYVASGGDDGEGPMSVDNRRTISDHTR